MTETRLDGIQEIARIAGYAARSVLARTRPSAAEVLTRAFRRDVTAFGYWVGGVEALEIAHRSARRPIWHLPGRVVVIGGPPTDHPNGGYLRDFLVRGGTAILEGEALSAIDDRRVRSPKMREAVEVDGPAFVGILPPVFTPLFWVDEETHMPAATHGLDVLVSTATRAPLVSSGRSAGGTFVHFATPVAPWRRDAAADAPRITPAAFAERVELRAEGPLAERDASAPEPLLRATFTMLLVMASVLATALDPTHAGAARE